MRPKVSFDSRNIWRRLEACEIVAKTYGWHPNAIISFTKEVREAFAYEDAMAIIERDFDILKEP
jgi:Mg2+ and Co2+ transporter CorA